jgi:hypothetical protein
MVQPVPLSVLLLLLLLQKWQCADHLALCHNRSSSSSNNSSSTYCCSKALRCCVGLQERCHHRETGALMYHSLELHSRPALRQQGCPHLCRCFCRPQPPQATAHHRTSAALASAREDRPQRHGQQQHSLIYCSISDCLSIPLVEAQARRSLVLPPALRESAPAVLEAARAPVTATVAAPHARPSPLAHHYRLARHHLFHGFQVARAWHAHPALAMSQTLCW